MKINRSLTEILIIVGFFMWIGSAGPVQGAPSGPVAGETAKALETETGYLENITFEKLKGKERVVLMLSRQSGAAAEDQGSRTVMIRVENLFVPQDLRRAMGEGVLDNLIRVVPAQQNQWRQATGADRHRTAHAGPLQCPPVWAPDDHRFQCGRPACQTCRNRDG